MLHQVEGQLRGVQNAILNACPIGGMFGVSSVTRLHYRISGEISDMEDVIDRILLFITGIYCDV